MSPIAQWLKQIFGEEQPMIEACLIGCIESLEEHVPTDEEVTLYLRAATNLPIVFFTWKDKEIVRIELDQMRVQVGKIFTLVNPFANIPE